MKWIKSLLVTVAFAFLSLPASAKAEPQDILRDMQAYVDKQKLYELNLRYARAVDRKIFEALHPLYAIDAIHDHGGMFKGSGQQFVQWLSDTMVDIETQHLIANSLFQIDGDTATGEIYTINFHHLPNKKSNYIAGGRYLDRYVKTNGAWQFQSRLRVIDWAEERPATASPHASNLLRGGARESDPSEKYISAISSDLSN